MVKVYDVSEAAEWMEGRQAWLGDNSGKLRVMERTEENVQTIKKVDAQGTSPFKATSSISYGFAIIKPLYPDEEPLSFEDISREEVFSKPIIYKRQKYHIKNVNIKWGWVETKYGRILAQRILTYEVAIKKSWDWHQEDFEEVRILVSPREAAREFQIFGTESREMESWAKAFRR